MVTEQEERSPWETESGLVDDVDAWIANPRFGYREEYAQVVQQTTAQAGAGLMFLVDLRDEAGEVIATQGWSVGSGWEASEDGLSISHPKRKNVVNNSLYGQLQIKVVKELGVDMAQHGLPTEAMSWDGLGFHWMQTPHETVGKKVATGLMPTAFLGKAEAGAETPVPTTKTAAPVAKAAAKAVSAGEQAALKIVAEVGTVKEFMLKATKVPAIVDDDALMAKCLDDSPAGFFFQHKGK